MFSSPFTHTFSVKFIHYFKKRYGDKDEKKAVDIGWGGFGVVGGICFLAGEAEKRLRSPPRHSGSRQAWGLSHRGCGDGKSAKRKARGGFAADVMVSDGALLLLSLDGKMAVQIETDFNMEAGSAVRVTLSDETVLSAAVESRSGSTMTVTLADNGTAVINSVAAEEFFGKAQAVGQSLEINGRKFLVVGVLEKVESVAGNTSKRLEAYISYTALMRITENVSAVTSFSMQAAEGSEPGQ